VSQRLRLACCLPVFGLVAMLGCSDAPDTSAPIETPEVEIPEAAEVVLPDEIEPDETLVLPGQGEDDGKTVVYRDEWGIPHIYAPTVEKGLYAMGYAQAQDRPEQLLQNILIAIGKISMLAGPDTVQNDLRSEMFDHYGVAKRNWDQIPEEIQDHIRAFARGMNDFYDSHPDVTPFWWKGRTIDEYMLIAFGRLFLYNWSIDEAFADLERGGIDPGYEAAQRGSNQWAVGPDRSANGAPLLYIDPHLSWSGTSRFWAFRIHAGDLHGSGVTLPGSPYIGLGHNENVAWAMTTGGPDTADIFELTLHDDAPNKYLHDGEWKEMTSREVTIAVRGEAPQVHTIWSSHHGPIVARRNGKAYAAAMAYAESVQTSTAWHHFNFATDYTGIESGLATIDVFPQNVMAADTSGNIYYQRTGRVPVRSTDFDWSKPVDGSLAAADWQGIHPSTDLLTLLNPPHGWMQNCNIPPDAMLPDGPFEPGSVPDYIFGSREYGPISGWTNQRGARAVELLSADDSVTVEEALTYAVDMHVYGADRWVDVLRNAHDQFGEDHAEHPHYTAAIEDVLAWDNRNDRASTGALKYWYWRRQLVDDYGEEVVQAVADRIDQWYNVVSGEEYTDPQLTDIERQSAATSFANAMDRLVAEMGALDAVWGDKFRVGRGDNSWPVGGGGDYGMRTLRSVGYDDEREDFTRWGRRGQTSTQIVSLTEPIQSWWYLPQGQSDDPNAEHFDDLAEKAFSPAELLPTWWLPEQLVDHIESREVLEDA